MLTSMARRDNARDQPTRWTVTENTAGWLFALPWIIGFLLFTAGPVIAALGLSFTEWDVVNDPVWVGLENYRQILDDPQALQALKVTTWYTVASVPLHTGLAFALALLLNNRIRGVGIYRTIFYLPSILPVAAVAVVWRWVLSPQYGIFNYLLSLVGIDGPEWLASPTWALPALVLMSLFQLGGALIIFLAGLQGVPRDLYEAAMVDGAGWWRKQWNVTIPMMTPYFLFQVIMGFIATIQVFVQPYLMTEGGPKDATLFYLLYVFRNAFQFFSMGYAAALSWLLFVYVVFITLLILRSASHWVYYAGSDAR
jgi:multiple sugar transport system permease protein